MSPHEIANMADFIAQQIHHAAAPEEQWADVGEDERNEFRLIAHAAMGAHDAWLMSSGYKIVKLEKKKAPKAGFIMPDKAKLVGLN